MKKFCIYGISVCVLALNVAGCTTPKVKSVPAAPAATAVQNAPVDDSAQGQVVMKVQSIPVVPVAQGIPAIHGMTGVHGVNGDYNFGDYRSSTLTTKAWAALADKDTDGVLAYTNKCISLYSAQAALMQKNLTAYPAGSDEKIFSYWALNDVATSLYIQGEALRRANRMDEAKPVFNRIISDFSYGQAYDVQSKTFWKPVDGAQDSLYMIENHLDLDYGNMTSNFLVKQMWKSLSNNKLNEVIAYDMKLEHLYRQEALDMGKTLKDYASGSNDDIFKYWALNDVGTGMFILGEAYRANNKNDDALKAYKQVISDYLYAQCWDPQGWFWKPADAAQQKIQEIQTAK